MAETKNTNTTEEVKDTTSSTTTSKPSSSTTTPTTPTTPVAKKTGKVVAKGNGKIYIVIDKFGYSVDAKSYGDVKVGQEIQI